MALINYNTKVQFDFGQLALFGIDSKNNMRVESMRKVFADPVNLFFSVLL